MSEVVAATNQLEEQLRAEGFKGTQRVMRILKSLRQALESAGYSFDSEETRTQKKRTKR